MFKLFFAFIITGDRISEEYTQKVLFNTEAECIEHVTHILPDRYSEFGESHHGDLIKIEYFCKPVDWI